MMTEQELASTLKLCSSGACHQCMLRADDNCSVKLRYEATEAIERLNGEKETAKRMLRNALDCAALVRRELQDRVARLIAEVERLKRERDAAVSQLRGKCWSCANGKPWDKGHGGLYTCKHIRLAANKPDCEHWAWRGLCAENGGEDGGENK